MFSVEVGLRSSTSESHGEMIIYPTSLQDTQCTLARGNGQPEDIEKEALVVGF